MSRNSNSKIWDYFKKNQLDKIALCNTCDKNISYKTTISNLKQHLKFKHKSVFDEFNARLASAQGSGSSKRPAAHSEVHYSSASEHDDDNTVKHDPHLVSEMWGYFEKDGGGHVRCVVCRAKCSNTVSSLREHLEEGHPKLLADILQNSDGSDNEGDHGEPAYTEIVYLEDEAKHLPLKRQNKVKKETKRVRSPLPTKKASMRRHSSSSDEVLVKKQKCDEELDSFVKYITCLLKQIPKHLFGKLQLDIVNIIMNAKLQAQNTIIIEPVSNHDPVQFVMNLNKNQSDNATVNDDSPAKLLRHEESTSSAIDNRLSSLNDCRVSEAVKDPHST